jgi:hypothetical protein
MNTLLISLVSDQTLPNVQLIKEMKNEVSEYLFISTEKMEKKGCRRWIIKAASIEEDKNNLFCILVKEFSFDDISNRLDEFDFSLYDKIILNLTGGTKVLTLATHDYFKQLGADVYYVTGYENEYIKIFPGRFKQVNHFSSKITIAEYLYAYGFTFEESKKSEIDETFTNKLFNKFVERGFDDFFEELLFLRSKRKTGIRSLSKAKTDVSGFLDYLGYNPQEADKLSSYEVRYLTGDWLEEYIGGKIKSELNLNDDEILVGVNLYKELSKHQTNNFKELFGEGIQLSDSAPDNEFDVMFIYNNKFYTIECKTSIINQVVNGLNKDGTIKFKQSNILGETIYKADYLKNRFGLFAKPVILTLTSISEYVTEPENQGDRKSRAKSINDLINRCNLSNITLIDKNLLCSTDKLTSLIISK